MRQRRAAQREGQAGGSRASTTKLTVVWLSGRLGSRLQQSWPQSGDVSSSTRDVLHSSARGERGVICRPAPAPRVRIFFGILGHNVWMRGASACICWARSALSSLTRRTLAYASGFGSFGQRSMSGRFLARVTQACIILAQRAAVPHSTALQIVEWSDGSRKKKKGRAHRLTTGKTAKRDRKRQTP